jgi:hypothetical protein
MKVEKTAPDIAHWFSQQVEVVTDASIPNWYGFPLSTQRKAVGVVRQNLPLRRANSSSGRQEAVL